MKISKIIIIIIFLTALILFYGTESHEHLDLPHIQRNLQKIHEYYDSNPASMIALFMLAYISITSMSIPGAIVLTLLAGAVFGTWLGTLLVSLASTIGATVAFFMSRHLFRDSMIRRYHKRLKSLNKKLKENGNHYLFTMRLIPVSPYVVINLMMGLTHMRIWSFVWITFIGMLPGNFVYVYAGRKISEIHTPSEILTWPIILLLTLIGLLPVLLKKLMPITEDRSKNKGEGDAYQ